MLGLPKIFERTQIHYSRLLPYLPLALLINTSSFLTLVGFVVGYNKIHIAMNIALLGIDQTLKPVSLWKPDQPDGGYGI